MSKNSRFTNINSLRNRYILFISAIASVVIVLTVLQFLFMDNIFVFKIKQDLIESSEKVLSLEEESDTFIKDIIELEADYNIYIELYQPRDSLIYTTEDNDWLFNPNNSPIDKSSLKPRIMKILGHKDINDHSFFETRQEYYGNAQYIVYSCTSADKTCELYYPIEIVNNNAATTSWVILALTLCIFLILVIATVAYLKSFIIPLQEINFVTKKITQMDFSDSCPKYSIKELDELSKNINALSDSLGITLENLKSKNTQLQKEIEKERTLTEARKDFIASASHELKTPISIIQGYVEGLKYGTNNGDDDEYYDIIIDETEKMNTLVLKLLEQTKYDFGGYKLKLTTFNIKEATEKLIHSRIKQFEDNGITFKCNISESCFTYSDETIFGIVLGNYISNAISHCDYEKAISVECQEMNGAYRISVINTGKPVSDEDINNIWNSFYRADKAHSRNAGRFGLGLSIVASLQKYIGQSYGVINHDNSVEFWFEVQKIHTA